MYRYVLVHRLTVDYKIIKSNHRWEFSKLVFVFLELRILGILFVEYIPSSTYIYITKMIYLYVCVCHTLYLRNPTWPQCLKVTEKVSFNIESEASYIAI